MLPKASEPQTTPAPSSHSTFTTSAVEQDVLPQVGSISVPGEQLNVVRLGEGQ